MANTWRKWTPAVVAVVVVAGAAVAIPAVANASVSLPTKTPAQVLELVANSKVTAFSGDVSETSDLGLPSIPASAQGGGADSSLTSDLALITGNNSLRVYVDGPKNVRVQSLGSLSEQDVIRHGSDVWTYDSKSNTVEHATIPAKADTVKRPGATPQGEPTPGTTAPGKNFVAQTPAAIAKDIVAKLRTTSTVTVDDAVSVAGRASYDLVLTPKASDTTIGSVSIAVDAATGLPLRVQVYAAGQKDAALSIGFSSLHLSTPSASLFDFTAPRDAKVKEIAPGKPHAKGTASSADKPATSVVGTGWDAVVTVSAKDGAASLATLAKSPEFGELTTAVAGGRVFHTTLFNVLFSSDGRIVAGAVSVARLQTVAAQ